MVDLPAFLEESRILSRKRSTSLRFGVESDGDLIIETHLIIGGYQTTKYDDHFFLRSSYLGKELRHF